MDMLFSTSVRPYVTVHLLDQKLYLYKGQDVSACRAMFSRKYTVFDCDRFG